MAAHPDTRACLPSWLALALVCLLAPAASASLDPTRLVSTVRTGPLEMVVALEDSLYLPGQRTSTLICVTNRGGAEIAFAPEPAVCGEGRTSLKLWKIATGGAWFPTNRGIGCGAVGTHSWAVPPLSPLESGGSTCGSSDLSRYGRDGSESERLQRENDPTRAFRRTPLEAGRYALQVTYRLPAEQNHWREPLTLDSDTLFFHVVLASPKPTENDLLSRYASAIDSCPGEPFQYRQALSSRWLPRFSNSRFFQDVFVNSGSFTQGVPRESLFAWLDPYGVRLTSRAMLLDLLHRRSSPTTPRDPAMLSAFARGDLAQRVIEDWKSRPRRWSVRDSVYAERKKYLIRGWPPYGTWIEPGSPFEDWR